MQSHFFRRSVYCVYTGLLPLLRVRLSHPALPSLAAASCVFTSVGWYVHATDACPSQSETSFADRIPPSTLHECFQIRFFDDIRSAQTQLASAVARISSSFRSRSKQPFPLCPPVFHHVFFSKMVLYELYFVNKIDTDGANKYTSSKYFCTRVINVLGTFTLFLRSETTRQITTMFSWSTRS